MKLFIATLLLSMSSVVQAYTVFDLNTILETPPIFAENENIPTWGKGNNLGEGTSISYSFSLEDFIPTDYQDVIIDAFDAWKSVADLSFNLLDDQAGDIVFDAKKIDGKLNILAEASVLTKYSDGPKAISFISNVEVSFDIVETWSLEPDNSGISLLSVALHEIGHALGLDHSLDTSAIMYYAYTGTNALQADDIDGIQYLYGRSLTSPVPEPSTYLMLLLGLVMIGGLDRKVVVSRL